MVSTAVRPLTDTEDGERVNPATRTRNAFPPGLEVSSSASSKVSVSAVPAIAAETSDGARVSGAGVAVPDSDQALVPSGLRARTCTS